MASIYKRENEDGTKVWRAVVRVQGLPSVSKSFERKEENVKPLYINGGLA